MLLFVFFTFLKNSWSTEISLNRNFKSKMHTDCNAKTKLFYSFSGFHFFTAVTMKSTVLWVAIPCSSERAQCFKGVYYHHFQGRRVSQERNQRQSYPEDVDDIFIFNVTSWKTRHFFILLFCMVIKNITKMYTDLYVSSAMLHDMTHQHRSTDEDYCLLGCDAV
jgi:hypothetical protein